MKYKTVVDTDVVDHVHRFRFRLRETRNKYVNKLIFIPVVIAKKQVLKENHLYRNKSTLKTKQFDKS
jgi:rRNA-processing protein FCF1